MQSAPAPRSTRLDGTRPLRIRHWIILLAWLLPGAVYGQSLDMQAVALLQQMAASGAGYDAAPLHAAGLPGLKAVLDRLLPDTAQEEGRGAVHRAVAQHIAKLGHDSYRVRESATAGLIEMGPAIRPLLVEAIDCDDAEVGWRLRRILRHWDDGGHRDDKQLMAAFTVYLREVDDPASLEEISRRAAAALSGLPPTGPRRAMLDQCLAAVGRSADDRIVNHLEPLLDHDDAGVAVRVVELVGAGSGPPFFAELLLKALQSDRPEVVRAAVKKATPCDEERRRNELRRLLVGLFDGDDDQLRSLCALPLSRDFHYAPAEDHLLAELGSDDAARRDRTLRWLGDPVNLGRPASDKLVAAFEPLLRVRNYRLRRRACAALAIYGGENVVRTLIPLLGDANASFAEEITYRLDHQRDKAMLCRLLAEAAENHADERVRTKATATLQTLQQRAARSNP